MDYIHIGRIVATFGVGGEMILAHGLAKKTDLKKLEAIFIEEVKDSYLPYFVQESKAKSDSEILLKLENIVSKETAARLLQKNIWLLKEDFDKIAGASSLIALIGYTVVNDGKDIVGIVEEVIEQPHQMLLRITYKGKEAYIPIHTETLDKIDRKSQTIYVKLPDGLLDVYQ